MFMVMARVPSARRLRAFLWWMMRHESKLGEVNIPEDPVAAIKGLLSGVGKSARVSK